jgi:Caspase domain/Sel1 repeat
MTTRTTLNSRALHGIAAFALVVACATAAQRTDVNKSAETATRVQIVATNLEDTVVVDCQLPGKLQKLGGQMNYLTPGRLVRLSSLDCRTRGGEYTLGDLSSGTLSLKRWLPVAEHGDAEAQYYVARIYANGMSGVTVDYAQAAHWYALAAAQGYSAAEQELGYMYEQGLGVEKDLKVALNLERKASGLGEDLDYAWKIAEAQENAARQVEQLSGQLEAANAQLQQTRGQLLNDEDALARNRAQFRRSANAVLDLRAQLEEARQSSGAGDGARVKDLESKLAQNESALRSDQEKIEQLTINLSVREKELAASLEKSQATSLTLNEVVASRDSDKTANRAETESLRARLAQTEQRLLHSEQELTVARSQYQRDVQHLVDQRDDLEHARGKSTDDGSVLLAAKQRELDRQQLQLKSLEGELAAVKRAGADSGSSANSQAAALDARNAELTQMLAQLRARYDDSQKQFAAQRQQLTELQSKSGAERVALVEQMKGQVQQQLAARDAELAVRQRHLDSLEYDAGQLKTQLQSLQAEKDREGVKHAGEERALRQDLASARAQALEQQDELEKARTEYARDQGELLQVQAQLGRERAAGQQDAQTIARLTAQIKAHEAKMKANEELIASLKQQVDSHPALAAANGAVQSAQAQRVSGPITRAPDVSLEQTKFLTIARSYDAQHPGHRYALLIGNAKYSTLNALKTPTNDVRDLARILEERYDFTIEQLNDATRPAIMLSLDAYTRKLEENDSLLIYFAGHGDRTIGPPERAYWLGVEANPGSKDGYIEVELIQEKIKQMRATHILLVADSCFSGAIAHATSATTARELREKRFPTDIMKRARMVLTSGGDAPVVDSGGDPEHSLFATLFIRTLRQNNNVMSGEMLAHEVYALMKPAAAKLHIAQAPTYTNLTDANHDFGDFYFTPKTKPVLMASLDAN